MNSTETNDTRSRSARRITTVVGAAVLIVALAALLGEWGWGESSQAQPVSNGPVGSEVGAVTIPTEVATEVIEISARVAAPSSGDELSVPVLAESAPSSESVPVVLDSLADLSTPGVATVPTVPTAGPDEDDSVHHGVDDHAVEHSDRHDDSEAESHGRDEEAHDRHGR